MHLHVYNKILSTRFKAVKMAPYEVISFADENANFMVKIVRASETKRKNNFSLEIL